MRGTKYLKEREVRGITEREMWPSDNSSAVWRKNFWRAVPLYNGLTQIYRPFALGAGKCVWAITWWTDKSTHFNVEVCRRVLLCACVRVWQKSLGWKYGKFSHGFWSWYDSQIVLSRSSIIEFQNEILPIFVWESRTFHLKSLEHDLFRIGLNIDSFSALAISC